MRARWLLALYPGRWRQRYGAELAALLESEPLTVQLLVDLLRGAFDAHVHPELSAPLLAAAGGGTLQMRPRGPRTGVYVLVALLSVFLVFGGLYAYRSQSPSVPPVSVVRAVSDVQAGRVASVEIVNSTATLTLIDGSRERATIDGALDGQNEPLGSAVLEYNRTHPTTKIPISWNSENDVASSVLLPLLGLLLTIVPIVLLALLLVALAQRFAKSRNAPSEASRYEWLARLGDLRDRGVLSEDEFQREKKRLLE